MDSIKFLKPNLPKLVIFLIISVAILYVANYVFGPYITQYQYPLPFADKETISNGPGTPVVLSVAYSTPNLLINLLIYYLVSCFIVYVYGLFKK